jgi:hypothetical protein
VGAKGPYEALWTLIGAEFLKVPRISSKKHSGEIGKKNHLILLVGLLTEFGSIRESGSGISQMSGRPEDETRQPQS